MNSLSFDKWQTRHQRLLDIHAKFAKFMSRKEAVEEDDKDSEELDRLIQRIRPGKQKKSI